MTVKQVSYLTKTRLSCGCTYGAGVILSCSNSLTVPDSEGNSPSYIDATIITEQAVKNNIFCGWGYIFSYNDAQIRDGQLFVSGSIISVICKGGLTQWVTDQLQFAVPGDTVTLALTPTTVLPAVVTLFGDVDTTYNPTGFVDVSQRIRELHINNATDEPIWVSFDGVIDEIFVEPFSEEEVSFGRNYEFLATTNVWIRADTAVPLEGRVILTGWY